MSIERTLPLTHGNTQHDVTLRAKTRETNVDSVTQAGDSVSQFTLRTLTQQIQSEGNNGVNVERLNRIQAAMDAGELQIDTDKIAEALVRDIF